MLLKEDETRVVFLKGQNKAALEKKAKLLRRVVLLIIIEKKK
tara:strand:+ start:3307 stop:3432 length:126 start_codon:yes stop_codon:yes gene_type:complete